MKIISIKVFCRLRSRLKFHSVLIDLKTRFILIWNRLSFFIDKSLFLTLLRFFFLNIYHDLLILCKRSHSNNIGSHGSVSSFLSCVLRVWLDFIHDLFKFVNLNVLFLNLLDTIQRSIGNICNWWFYSFFDQRVSQKLSILRFWR